MTAASIPSRRVTAAGQETRVFDEGSGDVPLVCVHGNPDSADQWLPLLRRTEELGRVVAFDLPGWGASRRPDRSTFDGSLDAHADFVAALLDELEIDRFRLLVHDWGALALSPASRRADRVEKLVVVDAVPLSSTYKWHWIATYMWRPRFVGEMTMPLLSRFTMKTLTRIQKPGMRPMGDDWLDRVKRDLDPGMKDSILRLYRSADPDVLGRHGAHLGDLTCPSLIIWGDKDPYVGHAHAATYAEALGGPTEVRIVAGAGHWPMNDDPDVYDRIAAFMR